MNHIVIEQHKFKAVVSNTNDLLTLGDLLWVRTVTMEYIARMQSPMRNTCIGVSFAAVLEETQRTLEMVDQRILEINKEK